MIPGPVLGAEIETVLAEYESRQADEDRVVSALPPADVERRRDDLLVGVGRPTGLFLNLVARECNARSMLELGTSAGYSTIWLADAARATGGRVLTVDSVAAKQRRARSALDRAGLLAFVDWHHGDAIDFLTTTAATFDFVLIDLWKELYIPCLDALLPHLRPGAMVIADNMLEPVSVRIAAARYRAHVRGIGDLPTIVLPVGHGLAVSRYREGASRSTASALAAGLSRPG